MSRGIMVAGNGRGFFSIALFPKIPLVHIKYIFILIFLFLFSSCCSSYASSSFIIILHRVAFLALPVVLLFFLLVFLFFLVLVLHLLVVTPPPPVKRRDLIGLDLSVHPSDCQSLRLTVRWLFCGHHISIDGSA